MKKSFIILSLLILTSCSSFMFSKVKSSYYYMVYPDKGDSRKEFMKYFEQGYSSKFYSALKDNNAMAPLLSIRFDSRKDNILEVIFLDPIKVTYKGKIYDYKKDNIKMDYIRAHERHNIDTISFYFPKEDRIAYFDLDDKNSHFILDMGKIKVKIHDYKKNKVNEEVIIVSPITFKMWANIVEDTSTLKSFFTEGWKFTEWAEDYKGELPLPDGRFRIKKD